SWTNTGLLPAIVTYNVTPVSAIGCLGNQYAVSVSIDPEPVGNPIPQVSRCSDTPLGAAYALTSNAGSVAAATYNITITNPGGLIFSGATLPAATGNAGNILEDDSWTNTGLVATLITYNITPVSGIGCLGNPYSVSVSVDPEPVGNPITQVNRCSDTALGAAYTLSSNGSSVAAASYNITITNPDGLAFSGATPITPTGNPSNILVDDSWTNTGLLTSVITYNITPVSAIGCLGNPYNVSVSIDPEPVGNPIVQVSRCSDVPLGVAYSLSSNPASVAAATYNITITNSGGLTFSGATPAAATGNAANILEDDSWTNTGLLPSMITYTITPVSAGGCLGNPYMVSVSIDPEPVGNPIAQVSRCSDIVLGAAYTLSSNPASVAASTYNITVTNPGGLVFSGATPVAPTGNLANILEDDSWTNTGLFPSIVTYNVTPVSATGCLGNPYAVSVSIDPEPVGANVAATRCSDEAFGAFLTLSTSGASVPASTYNIVVSNPGGLIFSGATPVAPTGNTSTILTDDSWTNTSALPVNVTYNINPVSGSGCIGELFTVTMTINPEPTAPALTTVDHCSNAVTPFGYNLQTIVAAGNNVNSIFSYTVGSSNPLTVFPEGNRNTPTAAAISHIYTNYSAVDETITYVVTPFSSPEGCQGTNFTLEVVVHPEPVGSNVLDPVCSTTLNHNIQSQITNGLASIFTYTFTPDPLNPGVVPQPPAVFPYGRAAASAAPITDTFVNATGMDATVTYTITPYNTTCAGTPFTYQVKISPNPTGVNSVETAVCSDDPFSIDPQNNIVPAVTSTFTWTATYDFPMTGPASGTGSISGSLHNETNTQLFAHYTVIPTAGTCVGSAFTIDLPINPEPVMEPTLAAPPAVCSTNAASTTPIGVVLRTNGGLSVAASSY
ncbi:MAG TPA: PKD-like domain-containing protein, partial [Rheinheimera sp.]|nr:PKD-like domain-containing protein [Rheinheimera sp.]